MKKVFRAMLVGLMTMSMAIGCSGPQATTPTDEAEQNLLQLTHSILKNMYL
ncbi:MAG: hypothetical protein RR448_10365 [Niameybacter sp.]|uniref:hypothetical protein n=1 Tax=Niameybacter sp. TaxID=2033640 RepID=UPI002FCBF640